MAVGRYQSWGRYPKIRQEARIVRWRNEELPTSNAQDRTFLPFGNGRSYGDVCLNDGGMLLDCRGLARLIEFQPNTGILRCESGVLLAEISRITVPKGWFLPVTPGTQFVTVGGAIANDVHGKNHHRAGTFGCHVRCFELLRSDGARLLCSSSRNPEFYRATIGGLGLTGVITWAEIQLRPMAHPYLETETLRFRALSEFFALARESAQDHEHAVAWVDCLASGPQLGRGLFTRGQYAGHVEEDAPKPLGRRLKLPVDPPFTLINRVSLQLFNCCYYHGRRPGGARRRMYYESFFYPLDAIGAWNRVYGSGGFLQYQCVVPTPHMEEATREILQRISRAGIGSFLAVLKLFGDMPSPGLLSFPMSGATLALDFPNDGARTCRLLDDLDEVTHQAGGRVNPSKDARMRAAHFGQGYPDWREMTHYIDPQFSSSFWRRVTDMQ